jgi:uncharacterized Zn finger protein (UPF0148 family)
MPICKVCELEFHSKDGETTCRWCRETAFYAHLHSKKWEKEKKLEQKSHGYDKVRKHVNERLKQLFQTKWKEIGPSVALTRSFIDELKSKYQVPEYEIREIINETLDRENKLRHR